MTKYERETYIQWNDEEDFITVFTCHQKWMTKCKKLGGKVFDKCVLNGKLRHVEYHIPKDRVKVDLKLKRVLTEAQKQKLRERMSSKLWVKKS